MLCEFSYLIFPKVLPVPEDSFMVAVFKPEKATPDRDGKLQNQVTVVGMALPTAKNVRFDIKGRWERSSYGRGVRLSGLNHTQRLVRHSAGQW